MKSMKISLANLQLDYVDLYLLHAPTPMKVAQPSLLNDDAHRM